jgi:hypothetical protein
MHKYWHDQSSRQSTEMNFGNPRCAISKNEGGPKVHIALANASRQAAPMFIWQVARKHHRNINAMVLLLVKNEHLFNNMSLIEIDMHTLGTWLLADLACSYP